MKNRKKILFQKKKTIHFLHIGKTGGSSLIDTLASQNLNHYQLKVHSHRFNLSQVPTQDFFMYFLRNPIDRFISGFYSRKRQGKPQYDVPWSEQEKDAFAEFDTPRVLAEALSSLDRKLYLKALDAMKAIGHVNTQFEDWLISKTYLDERLDKLFFVGFLETFEADINRLSNKLGLEDLIIKKLHSSQADEDKDLSICAIQNLNTWYSKDIDLYLYHKRLNQSK